MLSDEHREPDARLVHSAQPVLSDLTRLRLGRALQELYEPVIDEPLDPRLAELMQQLEADRGR